MASAAASPDSPQIPAAIPDPVADNPPPPPSAAGILTLALPAPNAPRPPPSSAPSSRRIPPPCWTHEETLALIDSYKDKWESVRRANLRAPHWDEVADAVSRRCEHLPDAKPKTPVQCRHKIEKLRKRYRAERLRSLRVNPSAPPSSSWVYFRKMDAMGLAGAGSSAPASASATRDPFPVAARRLGPPTTSSSDDAPSQSDDDEEDEEEEAGGSNNPYFRSLNGIVANGSGGGRVGGLKLKIPKAARTKATAESYATAPPPNFSNGRSRFYNGHPGMGSPPSRAEEMRRRIGTKRKESEGESVGGEMAVAVRMLGDGYLRMEQMKMDMMREMEKVRMKMELKQTEMVLESQRRLVDSLIRGFVGKKR